ncbi:hypothetical protein E1295_26175 [Nonomuraea mesophila]|uniref:Uncharacterized protein n=1 Tax=Nonomuraea mesophila TaxID=2530382 RepID=A0A4R5F637_9ACTN|nr:hypothetical protein [Nonomuraea mesophila]TDE43395.1 hypothetical protein E1295_26175 [Nonomuraea mesophila]
MDNPANGPGHGIAGFRLTQHTWMTELGNWIDAISPDGRRAGALLFDPEIIVLPGVRDRVVESVMTDRHLVLAGVSGLIPVADVVATGDQVWLLTAQAVSPTVADLLAAGPVPADGAAAVLVETAQTLLALHAAGVTHGSVHPRTVVITAEGAALLSERGLSDAVRGQVSPPERDTTGWASLARALAGSCEQSTPPAAALFTRAAAAATALGLSAARDTLLDGRTALPGGTISRDALARAARGRSAFAQPPAYAQAPAVPQDEGDIVTLLHVPGRPPEAVHFGPGVGTEPQRPQTTAQRIWRDGRGEPARADKDSRARRRRTILSTAVFAAVMAGAILAWYNLGSGPGLAVVSVGVTAPKKTQGCDSSVLITGRVVTNGAPGVIAYEWRKSLDDEVIEGTLRTEADRTSYTLPLRWKLQGRSTVKATATLRVLTPGPVRTDKASFTYRC